MSEQYMLLLETVAENMEPNMLFEVVGDALNRIKSNQEANEYVQYQAKIIETLLSEIENRIDC
jgi:hypothetical protein